MSKIDEYNAAKARAARLRSFAETCKHSTCDKFGATVTLSDTYKGYYGDSSCSSWGDEVIKAITVEIQGVFCDLSERAAKRAEREAELARGRAGAEAREILAAITDGAA